MFYVFISFVVLAISTLLFRKSGGSLAFTKPNMISYLYYYQVVLLTFIASVLTITQLDNHYVIERVSDEARLYGWLAVMYVLLTVPIGILLAKYLWIGKRKVSCLLNEYVQKPIVTVGHSGNSLKYSIWIFTVISIMSCLYTFIIIGYFPFLKVLSSPGHALDIIRIDVSRSFSGNVYVKNILALLLMPLLSYVWCFYYLANKRTLDGLMFIVSFILSASILYYNFAKAPLLWYILSFIFVSFYSSGQLKVKYILLLIGITFAGLMVMYSFRGFYLDDFFIYNDGPIGRLILGQAAGTYYMFDIFPEKYDFIGFSSISRPVLSLFGVEYVERAARIAMTDFNPAGVESGRLGVMNSLFIAEAWANFGFLGVILSPIWVGFVTGTVYIFFLTRKKNPLWLALFVVFSFSGSFTGGFNDYIFYGGYLILIILVFLIFFVSSIFSQIKKV